MSREREQQKKDLRSPLWSKVQRDWLRVHNTCAATGRKGRGAMLEVHHIKPYATHPELELADGTGRYCKIKDKNGKYICNLITLSDNPKAPAHRFVGHLGDYAAPEGNPHVVEDAAFWLMRIKSRKKRRR